jgi:hypothetical protein
MKEVNSKFSSCIILLYLSLLSPSLCSANKIFELEDVLVNAGIAFVPTWYVGHEYSTTLHPLFISADYGFKDDMGPGIVGIGALVGYSTYKETITLLNDVYGWKYTAIICMAKGTYHYEFIENFDIYAGMGAGFRYISDSFFGDPNYNDGSDSGIFPLFSIFAGGRYYLAEGIGIFGELGYGFTWLSTGLTIRI